MPWKEVSPGRWERPLDVSEAFFWYLNAAPKPPTRERWTITSGVSFETNLAPEEVVKLLRPAWKAMRHMHPAIAATLEKDKKVYVTPTEAELEQWLDQTIVVEPEDMDMDTRVGQYKSTPLVMLHYFPGSSDLFLRTSHWRSDGVGMCVFTNHFFDALANPREVVFGDEGKRLPPSLEEVAGGACDITPEKQAKIQKKFLSVLQAGRSLGLPIKPSFVPAGTYRKTYRFSEPMTKKIVAACKKFGLSVSSAVASSLVDVVHKRHPGNDSEKPTKYVTFPWLNLRPYLPQSFDSNDNPFTVVIINDLLIVDVKDFSGNAKQFGAFYSESTGGSDALSLASAWQEHSIKMLSPPPQPAASQKPATPPPPPPKPQGPITVTPALNSLGIFERYLNPTHRGKNSNFEITDFWFAPEILGPNILMYAWTFRGKMRLTAYYNEAFYDGAYAQEILEAVMSTMLQNLDLSWGSEAKL